MKKYKEQLRAVSEIFIIRILGLLLLGINPIILGRLLGQSEYGKYAYVFNWVLLIGSVGVFGLDILALREVSILFEGKDLATLRIFIFWSLRIVAIVTMFIGLILYVLPLWIPTHILTESTRFLLNWKEVFFIIVAIFIVLRFLEGVNLGMGRLLIAQIARLVVMPAGVLLSVFAMHLLGLRVQAHQALQFLLVASLAGFVLSFWGVSCFFKRNNSKTLSSSHIPINASSWFNSAWSLFWANLLSLFNERIGVIILGSVGTASAVGAFDVAVQLSKLLTFPLLVVSTAVSPELARIQARGNEMIFRKETQSLVSKASQLILLMSVPLFISLWVFGGSLLAWMGRGFLEEAQHSLQILLLGQFVNALAGPVALLLNMIGKEKETLVGVALAALVNFALSVVLVSRWRVDGIAFASTVGLIIWNIYLVWRAYTQMGIWPAAIGAHIYDK